MKKLLMFLLITNTVINLFADIDVDLYAFYPFENDVEDVISGNKGSFKNGATRYKTWNNHGMVATFDGTDDYVELKDFNPANSDNDFSISFWIYPFDLSAHAQCFVGKHTSAGGNAFLLGYYLNNLQWTLNNNYYNSNITLSNNQWQHVVVTVNGNGTTNYVVKLYVNGTLRYTSATISGSANIGSSGKKWVLGMDWDGNTATDFFYGRMDDVKFFSRAISASDVSALYARKYGFPMTLDAYTFSIEHYENSNFNLSYSHQEVDKLVDNLISNMDSRKYDDGMYSVPYQSAQIEDSYVTISTMSSSATDGSEIVFFSGHGNEVGPVVYNASSLSPANKTYGGDTKWVFFSACMTLYNNPTGWFGGIHALFGAFSNTTEFKKWNLSGAHYDYSYEVWDSFMDRWIKDRDPMYDAYIDAWDSEYADKGYSARVGALQRRGNLDGKYFNGNFQRIYDVYRNSVTSGSIWTNFVTFGNPSYGED